MIPISDLASTAPLAAVIFLVTIGLVIARPRGLTDLVLGARPRSGPTEPGPRSVGHVARFVVDHAPVPVLLVRRSDHLGSTYYCLGWSRFARMMDGIAALVPRGELQVVLTACIGAGLRPAPSAGVTGIMATAGTASSRPGATFDLLASGPTGTYWANGILPASTLTGGVSLPR